MTAHTADGRGGSPPPRPRLAATGDRPPPQWFVFGPWLFDVTAAMRLLRRVPRPAQPLPVTPWAHAYGLIPAPGASPHSVSLLGPGPGFDHDFAMTTDLSQPVIIATVPVPGGSPASLLIDGTHRVYKAAVLGCTHLPSLVLTEAETLAVRRPACHHPAAPRRAPRKKRRP